MRRRERLLVVARWAAWLFAVIRVLMFQPLGPDRNLGLVIGLLAGVALFNIVVGAALSRIEQDTVLRRLAVGAFALDVLVIGLFAYSYSWDPTTGLWMATLFIPLEGAVRLQFVGASVGFVALAAINLLLGMWLENHTATVLTTDVQSFRIGVSAVVAVTMGLVTRDLQAARRRAERLVEEVARTQDLRSRILSTLAHDVRSPLATAQMSVETVRAGKVDDDARRRLLDGAARQLERLTSLVNDLLDMARAERGRLVLDRSTVDLAAVVSEVLTYTNVPELEIHVEVGLQLNADPARLEQILANLLSNAQRHGGPPVSLRAERREDGVAIEVEDHGSEAPAQINFEAFGMAGGDTASVGLGLWIIRELTEAHGGNVSYHRSAHGGAVFTVWLPGATAVSEVRSAGEPPDGAAIAAAPPVGAD